MDTQKDYNKASQKTAKSLINVASTLSNLSRLSLPEIEEVVDQVAKVIPAGNVPGVILSGLARLSGRKLPIDTVKRDIDLLFKGVEQVLDKAVYSAFFAGPAAIIWGYQNLLRLAGKGPDDAFPHGTWQFYVDYAMREDTARHTNETHGFDTLLNQHQIHPDPVDRATAWTMAAIHSLHQYNNLLANEWRERVYTYLLRQVTANQPEAAHYTQLYRRWEQQRPYGRGSDTEATDTYSAYRQAKFRQFITEATANLPLDLRHEWEAHIQTTETENLSAYQEQMSILSYLDPGPYGEKRERIQLGEAHIGLIYQDHYYLIPACRPNTIQPANVAEVRRQIAALIHHPAHTPPIQLKSLAGLKRTALGDLRNRLDKPLLKELNRLRLAPILLNLDPRSPNMPLSRLRQTERGVGDQALTLFDTGKTVVFDQSHIYFDGAWGAALAEIMTNEAISWAVYLNSLPAAQSGQKRPYALDIQFQTTAQIAITKAPHIISEASAESDAVNIAAVLKLRKRFKQRSDLLRLTVNDLLVLYRAIHAATYQPNPILMDTLKNLTHDRATQQAARAALNAIESVKKNNPAIVIPVDASQRSPRDRLHPMTFEVPLKDLDLLNLHKQVIESLDTYTNAPPGNRDSLYAKFDQLQRRYLATLAGFGEVLSKAKEIAVMGKSASVGSLKLLAHMPTPLQRMLGKIPDSFDILNDLLKGREVISNVGVVAPTSTLTRFITAKDDNEKKTLAWGIITDAKGVMRVTLRDFRPHVSLLMAINHQDLADQIVQDYLDAYAHGLNNFITDLYRITKAGRETKL